MRTAGRMPFAVGVLGTALALVVAAPLAGTPRVVGDDIDLEPFEVQPPAA